MIPVPTTFRDGNFYFDVIELNICKIGENSVIFMAMLMKTISS